MRTALERLTEMFLPGAAERISACGGQRGSLRCAEQHAAAVCDGMDGVSSFNALGDEGQALSAALRPI